jgi:hypothetical protein
MLKVPLSVKNIESRAAEELELLLRKVPSLAIKRMQTEPKGATAYEPDILAWVSDGAGESHLLVGEVKANGQPRNTREAIYQLHNYINRLKKPGIPILIAPYLSPASRNLCTENGVSFLDFEGNARLAFGNVFIERLLSPKPEPQRREFRSLFSPKSAEVLRVLLRDPKRVWKVVDLANEAFVSLGHVSNVRTALLEREWADKSSDGFRLRSPDAILDAWKSFYTPAVERELRFYTVLHGNALEIAIREMFKALETDVALSSYSAAYWIAPYARTGTQYLYAYPKAMDQIERSLHLSSSLKGENVIVSVPRDLGILHDVYEPVPGIRCTSPVQTYLDLSASGERGQEAAEHLRQTRLKWQN